jgi:5-methylcytosine-specific restriction protein A
MPTKARVHNDAAHQQLVADRANAAARGYDARWQKARLCFLQENPLCVECAKEPRTTAGTIVDHIIPHRGNEKLFWDQTNWQALCKEHHDRKTARGE